MKTKIENLLQKVNEKKGQLNFIKENLSTAQEDQKKYRKEYIRTEQAQVIIQEVAKETQGQVKFFIEDIVDTAMSLLFKKYYKFRIEFVTKRNGSEANLFLEGKNGNKTHPRRYNGGGLCDVISLALRLALFNLKKGKKNNSIGLDEQFKFLDKQMQVKASDLLKELSDKLKLQFIVVSHTPSLAGTANRVFEVVQKDLVSTVRQIS